MQQGDSSPYRLFIGQMESHYGERLKTIVLFGSRARGEARPDSDHDFFVVIQGLPGEPVQRQREVRLVLLSCLADLPAGIRMTVHTPEEFEKDLTALVLDVCVDGICLYGGDYFEPMRHKALEALRASGFHRQRVGPGYYWLLPDHQPRSWTLGWAGYREFQQ